MKKILLTLFAVAAVVIACDKDALDQEISNINVLEQSEEINASLDISDDFINGLVERLSNYEAPTSTSKGSASTARNTGTACADNVDATPVIGGVSYTNRFDLDYFAVGNQNYLLVRSEDAPATAAFTPTFSFSLAKSSDNRLVVIINGAASVRGTLSNTFSNLFELPEFSLVETADADLNYSGDSTLAASGLECSGGGAEWTSTTANGVTTWTHPTLGSFTIQGAPFPLSGFLARMGTNNSGHTVLNYAGSTSESVYDEIVGDYAGN